MEGKYPVEILEVYDTGKIKEKIKITIKITIKKQILDVDDVGK